MPIESKVINFYKRWNIELDEHSKFESFKNRTLSSIDNAVGKVFLSNKSLESRYLKLIGEHVPISNNPMQPLRALKSIEVLPLYSVLKDEYDFNKYLLYLQAFFWLDELSDSLKLQLYNGFREDIQLSMLAICIKRTKSGILLYPKGAKLLDDGTISDVLDWLENYPIVQKHFRDALNKYVHQQYERNLLDDLRLALETLLKGILKNKKPLEKQVPIIGGYLKDKGAAKEVREMVTILIRFYADYQNEYAKHNDKVNLSEIEFILYQTGTFMRFFLTVSSISE